MTSSISYLFLIVKRFLHKFSIERTDSNEYKYQTTGCLNLQTNKPVVKLKVIILSLHRIITLSNHLLQIINSDTLQLIPNIKLSNIRTFTVSTRAIQGASIDMCISTKGNKLQVYQLDRSSIHLIYEISGQDTLISIGMDECGILACSETSYYSYIPSTNSLHKIYSLKDNSIPTCFTRISPGEYLLSGPSMGVLNTLESTCQQPSIRFNVQPSELFYSHPYILVLTEDCVHIYSSFDSELKQEISIDNCRHFQNLSSENSNEILMHNQHTIYHLQSLSFPKQIEYLLDQHLADQALTLAENLYSSSNNSIILSTKKRIALIEFQSMNLTHALDLFDEIHLDYHDIILEIPFFLPLNSPWPREIDTNQYIQWLTTLSDYMIKHHAEFSHRNDYYSCLLKINLLLKSRSLLVEYLESNARFIPMEYADLLLQLGFYHGAALLYSAHEQHEQTIDIWQKIVLKEYPNDETFPGIELISRYVLERNLDRQFEFQIAKWLFEQNEGQLAVEIFSNKYQTESNADPFSSENIIEFLQSSAFFLKIYLERMVFQFNNSNEHIQILLMNIYLDEIFSNDQSRERFQEFLIKSNFYSISSVFNRIDRFDDFQYERALLYGKMNEYHRAFRILVDDLEDCPYAENYCRILSKDRSTVEQQTISYELFQVYLDIFDKYPDRISQALIHLFSNNQLDLNFLKIIESMPRHWPISLIRPIVERAFRTVSNRHRSIRIELALARLQNQKLNIQLVKLQRSHVLINEYRRCKICLHQFYETSCVIDRDASQMHVHCARASLSENP